MKLRDLPDKKWNHYEKQRFLNDNAKTKTDLFDPESFKHDGFDDIEMYFETYVPALAEKTRLNQEFNNFTPPRLKDINNSPYQALVIRYGILRELIQQLDYSMEKATLIENVQSWQERLVEEYAEKTFAEDDDLLQLAKAAIDYQNDIDDSELHLIYSYFELHNSACNRKHEYYTWLDFFKRLASIDRFPKVSRSERPAHALDTIEKGLWSLQEQALLYEISPPSGGHIVGIPEDYTEHVRNWLYYEMSEANYLAMLEKLEPFDKQSTLVHARDVFGVDNPTKGLNQKRREGIVEAGVFPSELLAETLDKEELKAIVDQYGLDAHKHRSGEMIQKTIEYFEQSQKVVGPHQIDAELFLTCYEEIADGTVNRIPPELHSLVDENDTSAKLDVLFEKATAEIFRDIFGLENTTLLGQTASGSVADGEIEQNGKWLLWDNKRRAGKFKLDASTRAKIKSYIDTKNQQHDVEWFLIIALDFSERAEQNAAALEMLLGVEIRLIRAEDFKNLAVHWKEDYADFGKELPLSIFYGAGAIDLDIVKNGIHDLFA